MSYSRWSNSNWYSFYNTNEKFSLWHVNGIQLDISYDDCKKMTSLKIMNDFNCKKLEASEAILYINNFISDYEDDKFKKNRLFNK